MKATAFTNDMPSIAGCFGMPQPIFQLQPLRPTEPDELFPDLELEIEIEEAIPIKTRKHPNPLHAPSQERRTHLKVVENTPDGQVIRLIPNRNLEYADPIPAHPASLDREAEAAASRESDAARIDASLNPPQQPVVAAIKQIPALQQTIMEPPPAAPPAKVHHPLVVLHLGHLIRHFGLWLIILMTAQLWTSWKVGVFADDHLLVGGYAFYFSLCLAFMLLADSFVWFSLRGGLYHRFFVPGACLLVLAIAPGFALQLSNIIPLI